MPSKIQLVSLKNQKAFDRASKKGVKFTSRLFVVIATSIKDLPNIQSLTNKNIEENKSVTYYGFKISKKYGKANQRNLLRRRVKHILQLYLQNHYVPLSIIFIPRTILKDADYNVIKTEIESAITWCTKKLSL